MNKITKLLVYAVLALAVWNLCDYLYYALFLKTPFQFSFFSNVLGPVVFGAVMWFLDGKFPGKKEK